MQHLLIHHGYVALVVIALAQACCLPIPSEITVGFAGVLAGEGKLNLAAIVAIATLGELAGSYVAYTIGRVGGRPLIRRIGRYVLITSADLDRAERFFSGRGNLAVAIGRALPFLRPFVSIAAGVMEMPTRRFLACSFVGTLLYTTTLSSIGYGVGTSWRTIMHDFSLAGYVVVALIALSTAGALAQRVRALRTEQS